MIQSFRCADTQSVYQGGRSKRFANIQSVLERKLQMLDDAVVFDDLKAPPGNRLESLKGDRAGQHSIRINGQYRLCFRWTDQGPADVEALDYHS